MAASIVESPHSLDVNGVDDSGKAIQLLAKLLDDFGSVATAELDHDSADLQLLTEYLSSPYRVEWVLHIGKSSFKGSDENVHRIVFFTLDGFRNWAEGLKELRAVVPALGQTLLINVEGISEPFGGDSLKVCGFEELTECGSEHTYHRLPGADDAHRLIHIVAEQTLHVNPKAFALSWGATDSAAAAPFRRLFAGHLAAALAQDIFLKDGQLFAILRGTKRVELPLLPEGNWDCQYAKLASLAEAVSWVYQERSETRHRLLSDRLSIDVSPSGSLAEELFDHIGEALKQARDRYGFVILDRKDAYYKELRDVLKDARSQADLFAAKVRALVSSLLRDTLAVLILIGFTLLPKLDAATVQSFVVSDLATVFFRVLAGYFVVSFFFQAISHCRDLALSSKEQRHWLKLMRDYMSAEEVDESFEKPLAPRRRTFYIALLLSMSCYAILAIGSWHFSELVTYLITLVHPSPTPTP
jgi:hypothetical protein